MGGWKEIRGVTMCPMPCCEGYEERQLQLPLLQGPIICHKLSSKEIRHRQKILTTTEPPTLSPDALLLKSQHLPSAHRSMVHDQVSMTCIVLQIFMK